MPLVDYGISDESEEENEIEAEENLQVIQKPILKKTTTVNEETELPENESGSALFSALPKPKTQFTVGNEKKFNDLLLNKSFNLNSQKTGKESHSVKIAIPSLSDFNDDDLPKPTAKKFKPSEKGIGLFSVLPPPKNPTVKEANRSLVPQSVSKKQSETLSKLKIEAVSKKPLTAEDIDDGEPVPSLMFSSDFNLERSSSSSYFNDIKPVTVPIVNDIKPKTDNVNKSASVGNSLLSEALEIQSSEGGGEDSYDEDDEIPVQTKELELDDKALQILCGNKKKRQQIPLDIIDISGEEIMPDSKEWLLKQFTEEKKVRQSHKKSDGPSSQSRRKHQITYLAFQAKAQELELQNQWANNRMTRKQTQSKYGF